MKFPRIRFSLLSLLCFVLLLGSAGALWWNWETWAPVYALPSNIALPRFSPDDQLILCAPTDSDGIAASAANVLDAATGKLLSSHPVEAVYGASTLFSPGSQYLYHQASKGMWNARTGANLARPDLAADRFYVYLISPNDRYAVIGIDDAIELVALPSLNRIASWKSKKFKTVAFSPDDMWLAVHRKEGILAKERIVLISTQTGKEGQQFPCENTAQYRIPFSPAGDKIALEINEVRGDVYFGGTRIFDVRSGALLHEYEGRPLGEAFSPDGKRFTLRRRSDEDEVIFIAELAGNSPPVRIGGLTSADVITSHGSNSSESIFCGDLFVTSRPFRAVNLKTGTTLYDHGNLSRFVTLFANGTFACFQDYPSPRIDFRETRTGRVMLSFPNLRWRNWVPEKFKPSVSLAHHEPMFITTLDKSEAGNAPQAVLWRHVRTNLPWDAAKMPEFWLAVLFAGAFLWSLVRRK